MSFEDNKNLVEAWIRRKLQEEEDNKEENEEKEQMFIGLKNEEGWVEDEKMKKGKCLKMSNEKVGLKMLENFGGFTL